MDIDQKRQILARDIETALQNHGMIVQPHEIAAIEEGTVNSGRFGDLLTLSILAMKTPLSWYDDPETAREELPVDLFVSVFSEAVSQERNIRSRQKEHRNKNSKILEAMESFVKNAKLALTTGELELQMNHVWLSASRTERLARRQGWGDSTSIRIIGYLGAAKATMPAVKLPDLWDDLMYQHRNELQKHADEEDLCLEDEFKQKLLAFLQEMEERAICPWKPQGRQTRLF